MVVRYHDLDADCMFYILYVSAPRARLGRGAHGNSIRRRADIVNTELATTVVTAQAAVPDAAYGQITDDAVAPAAGARRHSGARSGPAAPLIQGRARDRPIAGTIALVTGAGCSPSLHQLGAGPAQRVPGV